MSPESNPKRARFLSSPLALSLLCPVGGILWSIWAWVFLRDRLVHLHVFTLPMAPCTLLGMGFLVSALFLVWLVPRRESTWRWAWTASVLVSALALMVLVAFALGVDLFLERWLVFDPTPVRDMIRLELKLMGRMSPVTAVLFLFLAPIPPLLRRRPQLAAVLALLVLGGGLLLLLGFVMGTPLVHGETLSPTAFLSDLAFISMGAGSLWAAGGEVRPLSLLVVRGDGGGSPSRLRFSAGALMTFLLVAMVVFGASIAFLRVERRALSRRARTELGTVADLKSQQITGWILERKNDADVFSRSPELRALLEAPGHPTILTWIEVFRSRYAYQSVALFDAQGGVRLSVPEGSHRFADMSRLGFILADAQVAIEDIHRSGASGPIQMAIWAPVRDGDRVVGAIRLQIDPEAVLIPVLRAWPSGSITAETFLGRSEGHQLVGLSLSHHQGESLLSLRRGLDPRSDLPAVQAALGRTGDMDGRDFREVPVMATLRQVSKTPWFLVVKVDQAEVLAPLRNWGWVMVLLALAILGMTTLPIGLQTRRAELRDIQQRLELERSAKAMAERFHHLMREANDIILLADQEQVVLEANLLAEECYGIPGGLRGRRLLELHAPGAGFDLEMGLATLSLSGSVRFETRHRKAGGGVFPVDMSMQQVEIDGISYLLVFARDITERVAHEREIERLSNLYASLSRVNQAIVRLDTRPEILVEVCHALVDSARFQMAWVGWLEEGEFELRPVAQFGDTGGYLKRIRVRADDSPEGRGPTGLAIRKGMPYVCNDLFTDPITQPWRDSMAEQGFASSAAFPIFQGGEVRGALSVYAQEPGVFGAKEIALLEEAARDISFGLQHLEEVACRARAEAEVRIQAERLRLAAASARLGIWELDMETGLGAIDERTAEMYGIPGSCEFSLDRWRELVHPEERERVQSLVQAALQSGSSFSLPLRILRPDGQVRVLRGDGIFLKDADGKIVRGIGLNRDITDELRQEDERRNLQIQLHQSQKLESLGILAGGVAHDMNNVLGAIMSRASAEREVLEPSSSTARSLDVIINACTRGRGVVKGLLCFARQDLEEKRPVDLNAVAREMVQLLAYTTLKRVSFVMDLQEPLAWILGDPGALSHALMNLCVNSVDAMPGGGTLTMRTRSLPEGRVQFSVQDTGEGMSPEVLEKAVEPFFTTKPAGKGTGLGLSMVFGTMKAHGGTMDIESAAGRGTEVILRFPGTSIPEPVLEPVPSSAEAPPFLDRVLSILVVDDDELIRESVGPMLEMMGHRVELAPGGMEALQMLSGGLEVDLVILDMNMPGLNGAETLPRILALRPEQPVLMSSGYSPQDLGGLVKGYRTVSCIQKPFTSKELRVKLAEFVGGLERTRGTLQTPSQGL